MIKVMTVVGTRPELIKMARVIALFDKHTNHILVHTGQNFDYELNQIFFEDLEIRKPDHFLGVVGKTPAQAIAQVIERADAIFEQERPDALLLYGDTNSCLCIIPAKRRKIPVFHMEAGNRCFDQRVPEELNRKVVDHLADVNIVLTEHARRYLLAEGLPADRIFKSGSHMREVLNFYSAGIEKSEVLERLSVLPRSYFVVSVHREENVDSAEKLHLLMKALQGLVQNWALPIIISTHPRTRSRLHDLGIDHDVEGINFLKPFGFFDYITLQKNALCVLSDSGTLTEEASLLGLTAVMIRDAHERPEGMDEGLLIMSGLEPERVANAVRMAISMNESRTQIPRIDDYEAKSPSRTILYIVTSYIDFVNRIVWSRSCSPQSAADKEEIIRLLSPPGDG